MKAPKTKQTEQTEQRAPTVEELAYAMLQQEQAKGEPRGWSEYLREAGELLEQAPGAPEQAPAKNLEQ